MSVHAASNDSTKTVDKKGDSATEGVRNAAATDECNKATTAETSRLDDEDDACFDSIG